MKYKKSKLILIYLIGFVGFLQQSNTFVYSQSIEGKLNFQNSHYNKIYLFEFVAFKRNLIDSANIVSNKFIFPEKKYNTGYYHLLLSENNFIDFILNNKEKNVSFIFDSVDLKMGVNVINSLENTLLWKYKYITKELSEKSMAAIASNNTELNEQLKKEKDSLLLEITNEYPDTYFSKISRVNLCLTIEGVNPLDCIDASDADIFRSSVYPQVINNYIRFHSQLTIPLLQKIIDTLHIVTKVNPEAERLTTEYFATLFASKGPEFLIEYLMDNYQNNMPNHFDNPIINQKINEYKRLLPGNHIPEIMLESELIYLSKFVSGSEFTLLHFWSPDCEHCVGDMPEVVNILNNLKQKVAVLSVPISDNHLKVESIVKEFNYHPNLLNIEKDMEEPFSAKFKIHKFPTYYLVSKEGKILLKASKIEKIYEYLEN